MLQRTAHPNGVVTYQSPLLGELGVPHGFSTRIGGISPPPYDSLNLGGLAKNEDDANTSVAANFRRLRRALSVQRVMRVEARQVHGREVWSPPEMPVRPADAPEADALLTARPGKLLVIRTADCVPILLAGPRGGVVAAVHAGWRGIVEGVVPAAIGDMHQRHGLAAADLTAAIGPAVSAEYFEVGQDVGVRFDEAGLEQVVQRMGDKPHVDLRAAVLLQLEREGLPRDRIDSTDRCTYRDAGEFFSHRRDVTHHGHPATGRMAAVIAISPSG